MIKELRVLVVEDMPADVELIRFELKRRGIDPHCSIADTREQFVRQLEVKPPDIILSDHGVPGFDGYAALAIARERLPGVPFLFVTGAEALPPNPDPRFQADGYVSKGNLRQLVPAIEQALTARAPEPTAGGERSRQELRALAVALGREMMEQGRELERRLAELGTTGNMAEQLSALLQQARAMQRFAEQLVILTQGEGPLQGFPSVSISDVARTVMQQVISTGTGKRIEWLIRPLPPVGGDAVLLPTLLRSLLEEALLLTKEQSVPTLEIGASAAEKEFVLWVAYKGGPGARSVQEVASLLQGPQPIEAENAASAPAILVRRLAAKLAGRAWVEPGDDGGGKLYCALPLAEGSAPRSQPGA